MSMEEDMIGGIALCGRDDGDDGQHGGVYGSYVIQERAQEVAQEGADDGLNGHLTTSLSPPTGWLFSPPKGGIEGWRVVGGGELNVGPMVQPGVRCWDGCCTEAQQLQQIVVDCSS